VNLIGASSDRFLLASCCGLPPHCGTARLAQRHSYHSGVRLSGRLACGGGWGRAAAVSLSVTPGPGEPGLSFVISTGTGRTRSSP
jgi:hypothetical protein